MTEMTRNDADSHDWAARAAEALAQANRLPPGLKRSEAIRKAGQLRIAADMKNLLMPKEPNGVPKVTADGDAADHRTTFDPRFKIADLVEKRRDILRLLDPCQGGRGGTNFDRLLRRFAYSLKTRVGWMPHTFDG